MKIAFLRFWVRVLLQGRIYYLWSKFYQATFERWATNVRLPAYRTLKSLEDALSRMKWRKDGIWELGDAIGGPKATYAKHIATSKIAKDCDEFALYSADRIRDMSERGVLTGLGIWPDEVYLLSVPWVDSNGKAGGHNVCVFRYAPIKTEQSKKRWAHVSNWFGGKVQWNFEALDDVVKAVLTDRTSLGWALVTPDLKLVKFGSGADVR